MAGEAVKKQNERLELVVFRLKAEATRFRDSRYCGQARTREPATIPRAPDTPGTAP